MNSKSLVKYFAMVLLATLFLQVISEELFAQKARVVGQSPQENRQTLQDMADEFERTATAKKQEALAKANRRGWPIRVETKDGRVFELQKLAPNGMPLYYTTTNIDAAATVSTNTLWPGGSTGFGLTGSGMVLGEWDGGAVRAMHQELTGRVTQVDGATSLSDHATHVAGTLIGSGVINAAKGMAYEAGLDAYDWDNDDAEMSTAAGSGLLISNHSYSFISGWYWNYFDDDRWVWFGVPAISESEDYSFGRYDAQASTWDAIAYNAPNYLIVKSAGNDRNYGPTTAVEHWAWINDEWTLTTTQRPQDGPFDCISGGAGSAKNGLTVGAIEDITSGYAQPTDVVMTSFSSWGPVDDGRIKPDIVANGYDLYSSVSTGDADYDNYSGTSMASPNTAGSLLLLQEHFQNTHNGATMRSATLKGLVIQTADEAGTSDGPDYKYGWGLLNAQTAAEFIEQDGTTTQILERTLADGGVYSVDVPVNPGEPLVVTLAWTDPAGTEAPFTLDPTDKALVNDLDLRIENSANDTYFPYMLDPAVLVAAATTGDNITDNVEKIYISNPVGDTYTITVDHKGTLTNGSQQYSLLINHGGQAVATNIKWEERFNTSVPPAGWNVVDEDGSGAAYTFWQSLDFGEGDIVLPEAGQSFWYSNYTNANSIGLIDEWLISPLIPEIEAGDSLSFWAGAIAGNYDDSLRVFVSTTGNNVTDFTHELDYFRVGGPTGSWHEYTYDLSDFDGKDIYVGVNYYIEGGGSSGTNSDNIWVDHFRVTTDTTTVIPPSSVIQVAVDTVTANANDAVSLPLSVVFPSNAEYTAAEFTFTGYHNGLQFIGMDTSNTMVGDVEWELIVNEDDISLMSWVAGAEAVSDSGVFMRLEFEVTGEMDTFVPINIESAVFDTGEDSIVSTNGGVWIEETSFAYGDVDGNGVIQAYDASVILQHVAGMLALSGNDSLAADLTLDQSISSLDASILLQYGVGIIDSLPCDTTAGQLLAGGELQLTDQGIEPGAVVSVPVSVQETNNLLGFKAVFEFNPDHLEFTEVEWTDVANGTMHKVRDEHGKVTLALTTTEAIADVGVLAHLRFHVQEDFNAGESTVTLAKLRLNENPVQTDVSTATLSTPTSIDRDGNIPDTYTLQQNHPNPFNPTTTIRYGLPEASYVTLTVYDLMGRQVAVLARGQQQAGWYTVQWDGLGQDGVSVSTGVYFYRIETLNFQSKQKMVFMK
ncbi:MAG: S8 family serine peptidase [Candidatus Marinimicrobia bacterium]|nr:S8 family serine peptidase [Candidatus Neomarinimicrobiota bacterium]MCF7880202.1 S8 family serine peptidase [Candidatus Neomarinimicrobiota bacterium]